MITITITFLFSLILSLILTPLVGKIARKYNLLDQPSERKVHSGGIPRIGGVAIYMAFLLPLTCILLFPSSPFYELLLSDHRSVYLFLGASLVFALGLTDDLRKLGPGTKFAVQIIAATIAYEGGIKIYVISLPAIKSCYPGPWAFPLTLLWFVLVINAVNLIDGLDGLAAGLILFASLVLLVFCVNTRRFLVAAALAALAGSSLGFLRYNFNPASIFMGDSGSYFSGYMLAALSIMGSMKSQATAAILLPFIVMGIPLMDAIMAPIRRFILGQKLFHPDRGHLHHRLMSLGLTHRYTVLVLYAITILMGVLSIILVHARDNRVALILLLFGIAAFAGVKKLGYFDYLGMGRFYGWFRDMGDEAGITRERRRFLKLQIEIDRSQNFREMWINICIALQMLGFDMAKIDIRGSEKQERHGEWHRTGKSHDREDFSDACMMKLELPLIEEHRIYGSLWLVKNLKRDALRHHTLRRVESLRRTIIGTLRKMED